MAKKKNASRADATSASHPAGSRTSTARPTARSPAASISPATRSEAARQQLISLLRSPREDVRRLAARLFAAQGDEAAVKFAQRVIRDGDDDVLFAAAINGLVDAADAGLLAPGARRKLFAVVSRYVVGAAKPPPQGWLLLMPWPEVLVALDRARAAEVLRSPKCLRQGNPELDEVFGAINRYGVPVDTAKVRKL
ncbi:MAG: HEAT repeat domain-containing protein, partial [Actinobacteria bacterium]|nr:HEAT repeat domain-containing protein [Actinomycetota bacterium]